MKEVTRQATRREDAKWWNWDESRPAYSGTFVFLNGDEIVYSLVWRDEEQGGYVCDQEPREGEGTLWCNIEVSYLRDLELPPLPREEALSA